jgi:hypothetical protein
MAGKNRPPPANRGKDRSWGDYPARLKGKWILGPSHDPEHEHADDHDREDRSDNECVGKPRLDVIRGVIEGPGLIGGKGGEDLRGHDYTNREEDPHGDDYLEVVQNLTVFAFAQLVRQWIDVRFCLFPDWPRYHLPSTPLRAIVYSRSLDIKATPTGPKGDRLLR